MRRDHDEIMMFSLKKTAHEGKMKGTKLHYRPRLEKGECGFRCSRLRDFWNIARGSVLVRIVVSYIGCWFSTPPESRVSGGIQGVRNVVWESVLAGVVGSNPNPRQNSTGDTIAITPHFAAQ